MIALTPDGSWAIDFTTERMAWGVATGARDPSVSLGGGGAELDGGGVLRVGIDEPPDRGNE